MRVLWIFDIWVKGRADANFSVNQQGAPPVHCLVQTSSEEECVARKIMWDGSDVSRESNPPPFPVIRSVKDERGLEPLF